MKIQPPKSNMQSQAPAKTDDAAAQPATSTDFFAALLASLTMQPVTLDPGSQSDNSNSRLLQAENQQNESAQPDNAFSAYLDMGNMLAGNGDKTNVTAVNTAVTADTALPAPSLIPATAVIPAQAGTHLWYGSEASMGPRLRGDDSGRGVDSRGGIDSNGQGSFIERLRAYDGLESTVNMPAFVDTEFPASIYDDIALSSASTVAAKAQLQASLPEQAANALARQQLDLYQQPARADMPARNDTSQSTTDDELAASLLSDPYRGDEAPQLQQAATLFHLQRGQTVVREDFNNKYINAFINLGSLIQDETARTITDTSLSSPARTTGSNFSELMNKTTYPGYELKIDLLPMAAGSNVAQTYQANIKIHPPELGSVIAKLSMNKKDASLVIVAENHQVKAVIEANLSQLKHQFQQADINLSNIQVEVQNPQTESQDRQRQNQQSAQSPELKENTNSVKKTELTTDTPRLRPDSIIDTYA